MTLGREVAHVFRPDADARRSKRYIRYDRQEQPRVSELMRSLQEKLGGLPLVSGNTYRFQFDDGA
ncbi:hypothetical protein [Bradyrhizobium sp. 25ACV]